MVFSQVLMINNLVNGFNDGRVKSGRAPLEIHPHMFSMGEWSADIMAPTGGILYSFECEVLFAMLVEFKCSFFIGAQDGNIRVFIQ